MQDHDVANATLLLLDAWTKIGGALRYGTAPTETSCFLMVRDHDGPQGNVWPLTVYPSGTVEVVFQRFRSRVPFDDNAFREEFRTRLNAVPGISISAAKRSCVQGSRCACSPTRRAAACWPSNLSGFG